MRSRIETFLSLMGLEEGTLARKFFDKLLIATALSGFGMFILWWTNIAQNVVRGAIGIVSGGQNDVTLSVDSWLIYWVALSPFLVIVLATMLYRGLSQVQGKEDPGFVSLLLDRLAFLSTLMTPTEFECSKAQYYLRIAKSPGEDSIYYRGDVSRVEGDEMRFVEVSYSSTEPLHTFPRIEPQTDTRGTVTYLPYINERTRKSFFLIFRPGIKAGKAFWYKFDWPGFWNALRKEGEDYFEFRCVFPVASVTIEIESEMKQQLEWTSSTQALSKVTVLPNQPGTQLTAQINGPTPGEHFRLPFRIRKEGAT